MPSGSDHEFSDRRPGPRELGAPRPAQLLWAVLAAMLLLAAPTLGQPREPGAEPAVASKEAARQLVATGYAKLDQGDLVAALDAFSSAHAIMAVPTTGILVAETQIELRRVASARKTLRAVVAHPTAPGEPEAFTEARAKAAELMGELSSRIPSLKVVVRGVPEGVPVVVRVDGETLPPRMDAPWGVDPGEHLVVASATGFAPREQTVAVQEGESRLLELSLSPLDTATDALPAGPPEEPGGDPQSRASDSVLLPVAYVGFALAGAGTLVGAITGGISLSEASAAEDLCGPDSCQPEADDHIETSTTLGHTSTVSFVVAGVGLVGGLVAFLAAPDEEAPAAAAQPRTTVLPVLGLGFVGLRGEF